MTKQSSIDTLDMIENKIEELEDSLVKLRKTKLKVRTTEELKAIDLISDELDQYRILADELKETAKASNDDWRYITVGEHNYVLDRCTTSPEKEWIARIDGEEPPPERFSGIEMLSRISSKRAEIIYLHIYDGLSFRQIGEIHNITKQAVHQHYKNGLLELLEVFPDLDSLVDITTVKAQSDF